MFFLSGYTSSPVIRYLIFLFLFFFYFFSLAGYFGDSENAKACTMCPQGFKQKDKGKTMCQQCLAGFYPGDIECLQCVAGRYMDYSEDSDTLATECKICGIGQYQDDVAKGTCKDIPPGMFELSIMYSVYVLTCDFFASHT